MSAICQGRNRTNDTRIFSTEESRVWGDQVEDRHGVPSKSTEPSAGAMASYQLRSAKLPNEAHEWSGAASGHNTHHADKHTVRVKRDHLKKFNGTTRSFCR